MPETANRVFLTPREVKRQITLGDASSAMTMYDLGNR